MGMQSYGGGYGGGSGGGYSSPYSYGGMQNYGGTNYGMQKGYGGGSGLPTYNPIAGGAQTGYQPTNFQQAFGWNQQPTTNAPGGFNGPMGGGAGYDPTGGQAQQWDPSTKFDGLRGWSPVNTGPYAVNNGSVQMPGGGAGPMGGANGPMGGGAGYDPTGGQMQQWDPNSKINALRGWSPINTGPFSVNNRGALLSPFGATTNNFGGGR